MCCSMIATARGRIGGDARLTPFPSWPDHLGSETLGGSLRLDRVRLWVDRVGPGSIGSGPGSIGRLASGLGPRPGHRRTPQPAPGITMVAVPASRSMSIGGLPPFVGYATYHPLSIPLVAQVSQPRLEDLHEAHRDPVSPGAPAPGPPPVPSAVRRPQGRPAAAERCPCPAHGSTRTPPRGCRRGSRSRTSTPRSVPERRSARPPRGRSHRRRTRCRGRRSNTAIAAAPVSLDPGVGADVVAVVGHDRGQHPGDQVLQGMDPGVESRPGQLRPLGRARPHRGCPRAAPPHGGWPLRLVTVRIVAAVDSTRSGRSSGVVSQTRRSARPGAGNPSPGCSPVPDPYASRPAPSVRSRCGLPGETSASTTGWVR